MFVSQSGRRDPSVLYVLDERAYVNASVDHESRYLATAHTRLAPQSKTDANIPPFFF